MSTTKRKPRQNVPEKYTRATLTPDEIKQMSEVHEQLDEIRNQCCLSDRLLAERFEWHAAMLRRNAGGREWAT